MILAPENVFLIVLALVWIAGAVVQDLKRREVDNIWNFSLIAFALGYRAMVSVFSHNYWFVLNGIIGLAIALVLGNIFYYGRVFAGGDAKLLIALGPILPLSFDWIINGKIFVSFIGLFLGLGSVYVLLWSLVLASMYRKEFVKEFIHQWKMHRSLVLLITMFAIGWFIVVLFVGMPLLALVSVLSLLCILLLVYGRAVEESCLVRRVSTRAVTVGDWLYEDVMIDRKTIQARWEGVSPHELRLLRRSKKRVRVKYGIPFTPSFLMAFVGLLVLDIAFTFFG